MIGSNGCAVKTGGDDCTVIVDKIVVKVTLGGIFKRITSKWFIIKDPNKSIDLNKLGLFKENMWL